MIWKILLEILAAVLTLGFGTMFWMIGGRTRVIRMILDDPEKLRITVTPQCLSEPSQWIAHHARPIGGGYGRSLFVFMTSDLQSRRVGQFIFGVLIAAVLIGSALLGWIYFAINFGLFLLLRLGPPGRGAAEQAIEWIQITALILFRWHGTDAVDCARVITEAPALQGLYGYVVDLSNGETEATVS